MASSTGAAREHFMILFSHCFPSLPTVFRADRFPAFVPEWSLPSEKTAERFFQSQKSRDVKS